MLEVIKIQWLRTVHQAVYSRYYFWASSVLILGIACCFHLKSPEPNMIEWFGYIWAYFSLHPHHGSHKVVSSSLGAKAINMLPWQDLVTLSENTRWWIAIRCYGTQSMTGQEPSDQNVLQFETLYILEGSLDSGNSSLLVSVSLCDAKLDARLLSHPHYNSSFALLNWNISGRNYKRNLKTVSWPWCPKKLLSAVSVLSWTLFTIRTSTKASTQTEVPNSFQT